MSSKIRLTTDNNTDFTLVSNTFIDEYMKDANGEFVKVYLFLLRCISSNDSSFSVSKMADALDHTEKDIIRALRYWEKKNLIRLHFDDNGDLVGVCLLEIEPHSLDIDENVPVKSISLTIAPKQNDSPSESFSKNNISNGISPISYSPRPIPEKEEYSNSEINRISEEPDFYEVFHVAEHYIGRPLSRSEMETFMYWYDALSMSPDLISYLVESCIEAGHKNVSYMNAVALSWAENGIHTVDDAMSESLIYPKVCYSVLKAFGIKNRSLGEAEIRYVDKWSKKFMFSDDIITLACEKTLENTGKASFKYADVILSKWHEKGVRTLSDISKIESDHTKAKSKNSIKTGSSNTKSHNFTERNYDFAELQKRLLQSS